MQSVSVAFMLSLICVTSTFSSISRVFLFQIVGGVFIVKGLGLLLNKSAYKQNDQNTKENDTDRFNPIRTFGSLIILIASFLVAHRIQNNSIAWVYAQHEYTILLLLTSWLISSSVTGKFISKQGKNIYYKISPFIKSTVVMVGIAGAGFYWGRLEELILAGDLFMTIAVFSLLEFAIALIHFKSFDNRDQPKVIMGENHYNQIPLQDNLDYIDDSAEAFLDQVHSIQSEYDDAAIHFAIREAIKKMDLLLGKFNIINDRSDKNLNLQQIESLGCIFNYCKANDIVGINDYFKSCYKSIISQGYLIGVYSPLQKDRAELESKMPRSVFVIFYPAHYILRRVMPKLPYLGRFYNLLTGERNKLISKAELLGRLAYSGFKVIYEKAVNGITIFIAQKSMTPADEEHPSFGPIVRLQRVGLDGRLFRLYKLRTMFAYSEFIQKEVFEQNALASSGKLKDDFRRNEVGNIMRKLWLDELPQIFNWLKGDINLVGVRALSEHYFSLYPRDVQELRVRFKPGLIPPYYADLPNSFDEIVESERRYLLSKQQKPFSTDVQYLLKALYNIIFKGARSS